MFGARVVISSVSSTKLFLLLKDQRHQYGVEGHQSYSLAASLRVLLAQLEEIVERLSFALTRQSLSIRPQEEINLFLNQHVCSWNCAPHGKILQ